MTGARSLAPLPTLRDYQPEVLDRYRARVATGMRDGIIAAATGAGKAFIAAEQIRRATERGKRVVFVAKHRRLVEQFSETLGLFRICHGIVMDGHPATPSMVQVCSRDTLYSMLENNAALPSADLIQIDECHNEFHPILEHYKSSYKTGFSATPCKGDGKSLGWPWQFVECAIPMAELIRRKFLVPVKCYNPEAVGKARLQGTKGKVAGDPVRHWKKYAEGLPTVVFAGKRAAAQAILKQYQDAGIPAEYLDAENGTDERNEVLGTKNFKGRLETGATKVLVTVGILVEGVDVPCLACAQILRGCNSFVLWRQAAGRIMRPFPGKDHAVLLDHAGAAHEFGLPELEVEWDVNPDADCADAARKKAKEERVISCPRCATMFSKSPECPGCGWRPPRPKKDTLKLLAEQADALLTEFKGEPQRAKPVWQKMWSSCLFITANRGGMMRQAAGMFSGQAKRPPWECGVEPLPANGEWGMPVGQLFPQFVRRGQ